MKTQVKGFTTSCVTYICPADDTYHDDYHYLNFFRNPLDRNYAYYDFVDFEQSEYEKDVFADYLPPLYTFEKIVLSPEKLAAVPLEKRLIWDDLQFTDCLVVHKSVKEIMEKYYHDDYHYLNFYENPVDEDYVYYDFVDFDQSEYEKDVFADYLPPLYTFEKIVLSPEKLAAVPLEKRLIWDDLQFTDCLVVHKSVKEIMEKYQPLDCRFTRIEEIRRRWESNMLKSHCSIICPSKRHTE